jgi:hypothetical protein
MFPWIGQVKASKSFCCRVIRKIRYADKLDYVKLPPYSLPCWAATYLIVRVLSRYILAVFAIDIASE